MKLHQLGERDQEKGRIENAKPTLVEGYESHSSLSPPSLLPPAPSILATGDIFVLTLLLNTLSAHCAFCNLIWKKTFGDVGTLNHLK